MCGMVNFANSDKSLLEGSVPANRLSVIIVASANRVLLTLLRVVLFSLQLALSLAQ